MKKSSGIGGYMGRSASQQPGGRHSKASQKPTRRRFTAEYKLNILYEADRCTRPGQLAVLLTREGLYSSHLSAWRRQRQAGVLAALSPKKRGRKEVDQMLLAREKEWLHCENEHLRSRLRQAERMIQMLERASGRRAMRAVPSNETNAKDDLMADMSDDQTKGAPHGKAGQAGNTGNLPFNLGGVLGGLGGLLEKLGELAEAGEEFSRSAEFKDASGKLRGVYGIHVKTGLGERGEQELRVEPFGNVRPRTAAEPPEEDVREPLVDIHEEKDHLLVLVELPGVDKENVTLELAGDRLNLSAQRGKTGYRKEIPLPERFSEDNMHWDCKNGILQIRLKR